MEKIHTREILALLERLENKTRLPQWQKHRARLGEDPAAPTTEYQTLHFTSLSLLTLHTWKLGTSEVPQRQDIAVFMATTIRLGLSTVPVRSCHWIFIQSLVCASN